MVTRRWNDSDEAKASYVRDLFSALAKRYNVMTDLWTLGLHRLWKRHFVATSGIRKADRVLDLAGGTGDIAALLLSRVGDKGEIVVADINAEMLRVGRDRLLKPWTWWRARA